MAITIVATNAWIASNNPESGYYNLTTAPAAGDLALVFWYSRAYDKTLTWDVPAKMSTLYDVNSSGYGHFFIGYRVLTSDDIAVGIIASWTASSVTNATTVYGLCVMRGVDTTTNGGVEADSGSPTTGVSSAVNPPAVTPATVGATVVAFGGQTDENDDYVLPSYYLEGGHASSTSGTDAWGGAAYRHDRPASSEDPAPWNCENTTGWYAWTCALKPAAETSPCTIYARSHKTTIYCAYEQNANYATAATCDFSGLGSANIGQDFTTTYTCYESFLGFPTQGIPDAATVSTATLQAYVVSDSSSTDFTMQARLYDYGEDVEASTDGRDPTELSACTLLATKGTSGIPTGQYFDFTSESAFPGNVSKTGVTRIVLCSDEHVASSAPTASEYMSLWQPGGTYPPRLYVVFSTGGVDQGAIAPAATTTVAIAGTLTHGTLYGAVACASASTLAIAGGVAHATWQGALAPAATTTLAINGGRLLSGAFAPAAVSSTAIAGSLVHAVWQGTASILATSTLAVNGTTTHAAWQGATNILAVTSIALAGAVAHRTQQGALAAEAATTVTVAGTVTAVRQGAFAVDATTSVASAGTVAHRTQQGALAADAASTDAIAGSVSKVGATAAAATSTVAIAGAVAHRIQQGAFAPASASTLAIAGSVAHATHQGALDVAAASTLAVAGSVAHRTQQGALAAEATTSVTIAGTVEVGQQQGAIAVAATSTVAAAGSVVHGTLYGALALASASTVAVAAEVAKVGASAVAATSTATVAGSVAHRTQQGAFAPAATSTVTVAGTVAHITQQGALDVAAVSSVAVAGSVAHRTQQGAFAADAVSSVTIAGTVSAGGPLIDAYRVGDYIRIEWVV